MRMRSIACLLPLLASGCADEGDQAPPARTDDLGETRTEADSKPGEAHQDANSRPESPSERSLSGIYGDAKRKVAENEIRSLREVVGLYRETRGMLPESLTDLVEADFVANPAADGTVRDPWGRPYEYQLDESSRDGYVIFSQGPDANGDEDDIRSDQRSR